MTKLDLIIERIRQLPTEEQEAIVSEIEFLLNAEEGESLLTDEQWKEVRRRMDDPGELIPHEQVVAEMTEKFGR